MKKTTLTKKGSKIVADAIEIGIRLATDGTGNVHFSSINNTIMVTVVLYAITLRDQPIGSPASNWYTLLHSATIDGAKKIKQAIDENRFVANKETCIEITSETRIVTIDELESIVSDYTKKKSA